MPIHCSTCGQDLPEPQRRLAEAAAPISVMATAELEAWVHAQLRSAGLLKSDDELAQERGELAKAAEMEASQARAHSARFWIKQRSDDHEIDETWWLRDYEQDGRNRKRRTEFSARTRLFKFTVPMAHHYQYCDTCEDGRKPCPPDDCPGHVADRMAGSVTDGALGTFHHPV